MFDKFSFFSSFKSSLSKVLGERSSLDPNKSSALPPPVRFSILSLLEPYPIDLLSIEKDIFMFALVILNNFPLFMFNLLILVPDSFIW